MVWTGPLALPYSVFDSGRIGMERSTDAQRDAAQRSVELPFVEPIQDLVSLSPAALQEGGTSGSLESSLIDTEVSKYLALANARVIQTAQGLVEEATDLGVLD